MTDEEIYCSELYRNISKAVFSGFYSGILLVVGIVNLMSEEIKSISGFLLIGSLYFLFRGIYLGAYKLFPEIKKEGDWCL